MAAKKTRTADDATVGSAFETVQSFQTAANDQLQSVMSAFTENTDKMREQSETVFAAFRDNMETAQSRFQAVSAELVNAAREETAEAVTFMNDLARAKTVADALEIQRNYWTNLFEARIERTRELAKTTSEVAKESFEPFSKSLSTMPAFTAFEKFFPFAAK
jgi:hypothetical protein